MSRISIAMLTLAVLVTIAALGVWIATDRHVYTKYQVVEEVTVSVEPDDPFAETGFYGDEQKKTETVQRDSFHLGLLPTPQGLFDKHIFSVLSLAVPVWALAALTIWWDRRRRSSTHQQGEVSNG